MARAVKTLWHMPRLSYFESADYKKSETAYNQARSLTLTKKWSTVNSDVLKMLTTWTSTV